MANDTFNPNSYGDTQIANALKYALEDHGTVASQGNSITALIAASVWGRDVIEQIIYRGSDNKLLLDQASAVTENITATLINGILHTVKSGVVSEGIVTISGIDIPAGTWLFGLDTELTAFPIYAILKDDHGDSIAITDLSGVSDEFTVSADITGGSIEVYVDTILSDERNIILWLSASKPLHALPYFPSLLEVVGNA